MGCGAPPLITPFLAQSSMQFASRLGRAMNCSKVGAKLLRGSNKGLTSVIFRFFELNKIDLIRC